MKNTAIWLVLVLASMAQAKSQPQPVYNHIGQLVWIANVQQGAHYTAILPNGEAHTADCTGDVKSASCVLDASPGYWQATLEDGTQVAFRPCAGNLSDELVRRTSAASRQPLSFSYRLAVSVPVSAQAEYYVENSQPAPAIFGQRGRESCYYGAVVTK